MSPMFDAEGRPLSAIAHIQDITERRMAQESLRASQRILNVTGKMARIGGWEHDLRSGEAVWTEALYDIIELPYDATPPGVDEHLGYYPPDQREILEGAYRRAVEHGVPFDLELQVHTSSGKLIWCRALGEPVAKGGECVAMRGTFQDVTERKQLEEGLRALAAELSVVEERERRELAAFLHDRIGQALAVLRMRFGDIAARLDVPDLVARVESLRDVLEQAIEETQSLTFQLSPPILYELGLEPALEWVGEQICDENNLRFDFHDDGRRKRVAEDVASLLYRSVRELLLNVVRHARATGLDLWVERVDEGVRISIVDDGVGFDPTNAAADRMTSSFGLFSVRERMVALGGRLQIDSRPGWGTSVVLEAPLEGSGPNRALAAT